MDLDGNNITRVTNRNDINGAYLRISPDEKKIINLLPPINEGFGIWTMNSDGTDRKLITNYYTWEGDPEFFPDSKSIIMRRDSDITHNNNLFSVKIDGSDLKILSKITYYDNRSPDFRPTN